MTKKQLAAILYAYGACALTVSAWTASGPTGGFAMLGACLIVGALFALSS